MKRIFSLLLFWTLVMHTPLAQSQYLSRGYDLINGNEYGNELLLNIKGYFLLTNGICYTETGVSQKCRSILSLNRSLDVINNKTIVNILKLGK